MILKLRFMRDLDDDSAPVDYTCVSSVSEGVRIQRARNIHDEERKSPSVPVVRHRADPDARPTVDVYGTRARHSVAEVSDKRVMKGLSSAQDGSPPARSIAYPENYGIPDDPFSPPPETQMPARRTRASRNAAAEGRREDVSSRAAEGQSDARKPSPSFAPAAQAARPDPRGEDAQTRRSGTGARVAVPSDRPVITREDGSQFEPPVRPEMPDWLRVAQQNNMPLKRPEAPRVQAAPSVREQTDLLERPLRNRTSVAVASGTAPPDPRLVDAYREAGYPAELLEQQERLERELAAQPVWRRHGAQFAVNQYQEAAPQSAAQPAPSYASYPPSREAYERGLRQRPTQAPVDTRPILQESPVDAALDFVPIQGRGQAYAASVPMERSYTHPVRIPADYDGTDTPLASEEKTRPKRVRIPWLAVAAFVTAMIAVALWLMQTSFLNQTERVLEERRAAQEAIEEGHPLYFKELIAEKANKYNLSPAFVAAIMLNESSFRTDATSSVNARGLMQLMEDTASWIHDKMHLTGAYSFDDLYDAETNVEYGCWYLNYLSSSFLGDPVLVAASFHAGQNEVRNWLNDSHYSSDGVTIALENLPDGPTKQYVTRVIDDFAAYKRLYYENTEDDA